MQNHIAVIQDRGLYSEAEAADLLGLTDQALRYKRQRNEGPPFVRLGKRAGIRYRGEDLLGWLAERVER